MFAAALDDIDGNNSDSLSPASIIEAALGWWEEVPTSYGITSASRKFSPEKFILLSVLQYCTDVRPVTSPSPSLSCSSSWPSGSDS
jgi:hypothetical protein